MPADAANVCEASPSRHPRPVTSTTNKLHFKVFIVVSFSFRVIGLLRLEQNLFELFFARAGVRDGHPQDVALRRRGQ